MVLQINTNIFIPTPRLLQNVILPDIIILFENCKHDILLLCSSQLQFILTFSAIILSGRLTMKNVKLLFFIRVIILTFITALLFSMSNNFAAAENPLNIRNRHWSTTAVEACRNYGVLKNLGNVRFEPDEPVSRAVFASMVNRAFGYNSIIEPEFNGSAYIETESWYSNDIKTAAALQYLIGYGNGSVGPDDKVTREQAAVILCKILRIKSSNEKTAGFLDMESVSPWAAEYVLAMKEAGYMLGHNNFFNPKNSITFGETAQLLSNIFGTIIDKDTDAKGVVFKNVTIRKPCVTLKNAVITGDLYITEGAGDGDITLENLKIEGRMLVAGGGENSINIKGISIKGCIIADKPRVAGKEALRINLTDYGSLICVSEGYVNEIIFNREASSILYSAGKMAVLDLSRLKQSGKAVIKPEIKVMASARVDKIIANSSVLISGNGNINYLEAYSDGIEILSEIKINHKNINTKNKANVKYENMVITGTGITENTNLNGTGNNSSEAAIVLTGTVHITGTYKIGCTLTADTSGVSTVNGSFTFNWYANGVYAASGRAYTIKPQDAGKKLTCEVTREETSGKLTAFGKTVPYSLTVLNSGCNEYDIAVSLSGDTGEAGAVITLNYLLSASGGTNALKFSGCTGLENLTYAGQNVSQSYTVNPADAVNGIITIFAEFKHSDLFPDKILFPNAIKEVYYGDNPFTYKLTDTGAGSGKITYKSSNTDVAVVDENGCVSILMAGSAVITAEKAPDEHYAGAQAAYTLTVNRKTLEITGFNIKKSYNGLNNVNGLGELSFSGLVNGETATVGTDGVTALYKGVTVGDNIDIYFTGSFNIKGGTANPLNYSIKMPAEIKGIIELANPEAPNAPKLISKDISTVILDKPDNASPLFALEYAISGNEAAALNNWQESSVFTGLLPETTYYFYTRYKFDENKNRESAPSPCLTVLIEKPLQTGVPAFSNSIPPTYGTEIYVDSGSLGITSNLTYNWFRSDDATIKGELLACGTSYTPTADDIGKYLIVTASTPDADGIASVTSLTTVGKKKIVVTAGIPDKTLTPINSVQDTNYGICTDFYINVDGLINGDSVEVEINKNNIFGLDMPDKLIINSNSKAVSVTYDGVTAFPSAIIELPLFVNDHRYIIDSTSPAIINIIDGQNINRAIPVTNKNITEFNMYANTAAGLSKYYELTENIELPLYENNWVSIGKKPSAAFSGGFNGKGYIISNLNIKTTESDQGMFGYIKGMCEIKNLALENVRISGGNNIGGIAGYIDNSNSSIISECYVIGDISGGTYVGGIVGYTNSGTILNCYTSGTVNGFVAGGIAGNNGSVIENCFSVSDIGGSDYLGGITGRNENSVKGCYALNRKVSNGSNDCVSGRIISSNYGYSIANYAYTGMGTAKTVNSDNGINLENVMLLTAWQTPSGPPPEWRFNDIWLWDETGENMPSLINTGSALKWPDYIRINPEGNK